jgi:hypothetical protein
MFRRVGLALARRDVSILYAGLDLERRVNGIGSGS